MSRQHVTPVLLSGGGSHALTALPPGTGPEQISEADLQALIHAHPQCLPIAEIDPLFAHPVPLCRELNTAAGPIDNLLVTPTGPPVVVECKLWRNPEARCHVVGQILDYAKQLTRWTASDLQREVARQVGGEGNPILRLLAAAGHAVDEIAFNDALTHNLRRGRFLLLIVGDGIREGVKAIAEYLQVHAGLHFSLGLVELPVFVLPAEDRLVVPRVLARTELITRTVVVVPEGQTVLDDAIAGETENDERADPLSRISFWTDFVSGLVLDDPEQPRPKAGRQGYVTATMPVPGGHCWLVSYRSEPSWEVGVYLSFTRGSIGASVNDVLLDDWAAIAGELGGTAEIAPDRDGRRLIQDSVRTGPWTTPSERERSLAWLRRRTNDFINVLRPRIRAAVADLSGAP